MKYYVEIDPTDNKPIQIVKSFTNGYVETGLSSLTDVSYNYNYDGSVIFRSERITRKEYYQLLKDRLWKH